MFSNTVNCVDGQDAGESTGSCVHGGRCSHTETAVDAIEEHHQTWRRDRSGTHVRVGGDESQQTSAVKGL